jgi:hypothetical protein
MARKWARGSVARVAAIGMAMTLGATDASATIYNISFRDDPGYSTAFRLNTKSIEYSYGLGYFETSNYDLSADWYGSSYPYGRPDASGAFVNFQY